jgi:hypothetical protein
VEDGRGQMHLFEVLRGPESGFVRLRRGVDSANLQQGEGCLDRDLEWLNM